MIITIDGPMASGKSSVARSLAHELHWYFLSTGLLYRGLAYLLVEHFLYDDQKLLNPVQQDLVYCFDPANFGYQYDMQLGERFLFKGVDITSQLKNGVIDQYSSMVSTHPAVRNLLTQVQRAIALQHNVVIEGRDSGSVVFPYAEYKFFLTASSAVRAQRWLDDQRNKGFIVPYEQAMQELIKRDDRDRTRAVAPLIIPDGALIIDSSAMNKDEVVALILAQVHAQVRHSHNRSKTLEK